MSFMSIVFDADIEHNIIIIECQKKKISEFFEFKKIKNN